MDEKFGGAQSRRGKIVFRVLHRCEQYEYVRVRERATLKWVLNVVRHTGVYMKNGSCSSKIRLVGENSLTW